VLGSIKPEELSIPSAASTAHGSLTLRIIGNMLALLLTDAAALWFSSAIFSFIRVQVFHQPYFAYEPLWLAVWMSLWLILAVINGLYPSYGLDLTEQIKRTSSVFTATLLSTFAALLLAPNTAGFSRMLLIFGGFLAVPISIFFRRLMTLILVRFNLWGVPVLIVGNSDVARQLNRILEHVPALGYRPELRQIEQLDWNPSTYTSSSARIAFIGDPHMQYRQREAIIAGPLAGFRRVFLAVDTPALDIGWADARYLGSVRVLELRRLHLDPTELRVKRVIDLCMAVVMLPVILTVMVILAILIKLDSPGPVFYAADRLGLRGRSFKCFKFRTMRVNAEEYLEEMLKKDPALKAEYDAFHKLRHDPRVTRVGTFLRKTSLDELPQIMNVLWGDMSLVGPRPYLPREREYMHPYTDAVLSCRPGITGWWQVEARNSARFDERLQLDIFYIRRWSIWLDLHILIRTVMVVLQGRGAY
jgi:Undecaprenyl-phosphate galactose phosphotransferase WbaP